MLKRLARLVSPEERRLNLDGGETVQGYLSCYRRLGPEGCRLRLTELEPAHHLMDSSLHRRAGSEEANVPALLYASARLPDCMPRVRSVTLAADRPAFGQHGLGEVSLWEQVMADKRRRLGYFDGKERLAMLVCSLSDLDDLIPSLCAYQIEWNKLHRRLAACSLGRELASGKTKASEHGDELRTALGLGRDNYQTLAGLWGRGWDDKMAAVAAGAMDLELVMLPLSQDDFEDAARRWWERMLGMFAELDLPSRPVFLVTSNNHSLVNLVSGFSLRRGDELTRHGLERMDAEWADQWRRLSSEESPAAANLLYLAQNGLLAVDATLAAEERAMEEEAGVHRCAPVPPLLAEAQVIELNRVIPGRLDPRLKRGHARELASSRAVILNTDYPLGFGAYHLLRSAGRFLPHWQGLFVLGKSAAMIGRLGDVMIPTQVRDVHSARLFELHNAMNIRRLLPYLHDAAVFDDQRSLTVHGTFLHSWDTVRRLHRADFTGIEMEAGPCLAALADHFMPGRAQRGGLVRLDLPRGFSLGILHYTSDTPYNLRASLLSRPLGLTGLESTYSCSLAIMQYILDQAATAGR